MTAPKDPLVEALLALQAFEGLTDPSQTNPSYDRQLKQLRGPIPVSVLMHHYERRRRKKWSIAAARNGVCGHCHLGVPRALVLQMTRLRALATCPHCEGFLYMETEPTVEDPPKKIAPKKPKTAAKTALTTTSSKA